MEDSKSKRMRIKLVSTNPLLEKTTLQDLEKLDLVRARGWVIEELNVFERCIDAIICDYFKPPRRQDFEEIILNSSIIGFPQKLNIVINIRPDLKKICNDLKQLSNIRNGFAHASIKTRSEINFTEKTKKFTKYLKVINGGGKLDEKLPKDYLKDFWILDNQIRDKFVKQGVNFEERTLQ